MISVYLLLDYLLFDILFLCSGRRTIVQSVSGYIMTAYFPFVNVRQRPLSAVNWRIFSFRASAAMSCSSVRCMR